MAISVTVELQTSAQGELRSYGYLNLGTYVSGGVPVTANNLKLGDGNFNLSVKPTAGIFFEYDKTNKKVKAFYPVQIVHNAAPAAQPVSVTTADTGLEATFGATANFPGREALAVDLSAFVARFDAVGAY